MTTSTIPLLLAFAGAILIVKAVQNPYCKICNVHTMCQTRRHGPTCDGKSPRAKRPSETDKAAILHSHNRLRNKVAKGKETKGKGGPQPKAANMMMMEWDNDLAIIAQRAADQCVYGHDCAKCRALERDRRSVGQNIGIHYSNVQLNAVNWTYMVENFYFEEVHRMPPQAVSNYTHNAGYARYSQMMWWNSRLVGCGASMYRIPSWFVTLIFCNYRTGAHFPNAKVYEVGTPASNCPTGTRTSNPEYNKLCVIQGTRSKYTFQTDGKKLGLSEGTEPIIKACHLEGFRLY